MSINILSPKIYNRIAAGEVVERPASVVKELVENSLDAGATSIRVEIENGGIKKIIVADNGCGIEKEDLPLAFLPHATSKIKDLDDLDAIHSLGFRGEALASIASVSMISLSTKTAKGETGYLVSADGGEISTIKEVARQNGTSITVQNLFYNTPVRAKFLKKPKTEEGEVTTLIEKFMLSHPEIAFTYVVDGKEVYKCAGGSLEDVIYMIYGREIHAGLLAVDHAEDGVKVTGFIDGPKYSRPNRSYQSLFVNGRYVENYMVSACVQGAFAPFLMKGRFPIYVIKLEIPFDRVDVNVHPNKKEVKFDNSSAIFGIIRRAVEEALVSSNLVAEFQFDHKEEENWKQFDVKNDESPMRTDFHANPSTKFDNVCSGEGVSFMKKVDSSEMNEKIFSPKEYQNKGIDIINMPNFATVKSDDNRKNKPGGKIFFNDSGEGILHEVEISVSKKIEEEKQNAYADKSEQGVRDLSSQKSFVNENIFANLETSKNEKFEATKFLEADADEVKVLGVVFATYIITQFGDSLYVIDQHAMHERQNYDNLKKQIEQNNLQKQGLLVPFETKVIAKDREILADKLSNLKQIGFEVEMKGDNFVVSAVPAVLTGINLQNFLQEILSEPFEKQTASGLVNDKLCQSACKHSIRAGDSISKSEILFLINKIKDGVPLCPHGRPIILQITRKTLEKMFGRIL